MSNDADKPPMAMRDTLVAARVTPAEKRDIERRARNAKTSLSGYLRAKLFPPRGQEERVRALKEKYPPLYAVWFELNKQGNNLNQLTHAVHSGYWQPGIETENTLDHTRKTVEGALEALEAILEAQGIRMHQRGRPSHLEAEEWRKLLTQAIPKDY